jgi:putative ABC transport system permease protein
MSAAIGPPALLRRLLRRILPGYAGETAVGDFEEEYGSRAAEHGRKRADLWYAFQILKSLPYFVVDGVRWGVVMFKNYLTVTWRDVKNNPVFSFINIFGLAAGMACCIVIMLFVKQEMSYDKFHQNAGHIYRVIEKRTTPGREMAWPMARAVAGPAMKEDFPEVRDFTRFQMHRWFVIESGGKRLTTDPAYADPQFFDIFSFPLVLGDRKTLFDKPDNVVVSETLAGKFFGRENPLGKVITLYSLDRKFDLQVTGVMRDVPAASHLHFDFIAPYSHLENRATAEKRDLTRESSSVYLLLAPSADPAALEKKFPAFLKKHFSERYAAVAVYSLQPLTAIHLRSTFDLDIAVRSKASLSYGLSAVAFLILLIAGINSVNLSTARSGRRSREVGLRKVVGARRLQVFTQFLGESLFLAFLSALLAVALAVLLIPFFNSLMAQQLHLDFKGNAAFFGMLLLLTVFVGVLSGAYPAVFLSSYRPAETLKGETKAGSRSGVFLRKGLVVVQFALSLVFIIGTLTMMQQMRYVRNRDLGFKTDNVVEIPIFKDKLLTEKAELIKRELGQNPDILEIIVSDGEAGTYGGYPIQCLPEGFPGDRPVLLNFQMVGDGYFRFFGIPILQGRDFSAQIKTDAESGAVLNESAVKLLGWKDPIGKVIKGPGVESFFGRKEGVTVLGVVKDVHNGTLHEEIKPSIYHFRPDQNSNIYIRIRPQNVQRTLSFLRDKWKELPTHLIFEYFFLDALLQHAYQGDRNTMKIFTFAAILAVTLACLGLFGLALFTAERRKREIGIRKAIGATESKIVMLLSKDFARLVLVANVIAWPVGYFVGRRWLDDFAYRIGIRWWVFVLASALTLLIAFLTISYQSVKAASSNPAEILRHE